MRAPASAYRLTGASRGTLERNDTPPVHRSCFVSEMTGSTVVERLKRLPSKRGRVQLGTQEKEERREGKKIMVESSQLWVRVRVRVRLG